MPLSKMASGSRITADIWSLTMEIIHLLFGQAFPEVQPGDHVTITVSPPPSLKPKRHSLEKILEVSRKITDLLIAEMESPLQLRFKVKVEKEAEPVAEEAGPVTEEAGYSGAGRDLQSEVKMEPCEVIPVRSRQRKNRHGSAAEETNVSSKEPRKEEESSLMVIGTDGRYGLIKAEEHASILSHGEMEDDITAESTGAPTTASLPSALLLGNLSSHPSTYTATQRVFPPHHTNRRSKKLFSCSDCGKCFNRNSHLTTHRRIHTGERPYACSLCGKCFYDISNRNKHERVHTGEKPYSCSECGKYFSQKSQLISHERVHTGNKPHSCSECGKCFASKSDLLTHERVHTGENPYLCSKCGKAFSNKTALSLHERVHIREKPFSCSECGQSFSLKMNLIKHEKVHTGEKPYSCSECGKCFSSNSKLIIHERLHTL